MTDDTPPAPAAPPDPPEPLILPGYGERLRLIRDWMGWRTQTEAAKAFEWPTQKWNNWEVEKDNISLASAIVVSRRTGWTLDWIFLGSIETLNRERLQFLASAGASPDPSPEAHQVRELLRGPPRGSTVHASQAQPPRPIKPR